MNKVELEEIGLRFHTSTQAVMGTDYGQRTKSCQKNLDQISVVFISLPGHRDLLHMATTIWWVPRPVVCNFWKTPCQRIHPPHRRGETLATPLWSNIPVRSSLFDSSRRSEHLHKPRAISAHFVLWWGPWRKSIIIVVYCSAGVWRLLSAATQ